MLKRGFDIIFSCTALLFLAPVMLAVSLLVRLDFAGPIFYRGVRSGLNGKPFRIFKFRTMVENADKMGGPSTALNDPRLTRVGRVLRKYKLDELPQFLNVLCGDMSVVGPRPQVTQYTSIYGEEEKVILTVKPGLTDYASIRFVNLDKILGDDGVDDKYLREVEPVKNSLATKYAKEHSFLGDIKIIILTILCLFRIRSLWNTDR